jgi:putative nucleotidyltransferase with HDIG domain
MDQNVLRSVGLLRAFVLLSAAVLAGGAVVLGIVLGHSVRTQALSDRRDSLSQYVDGVLAPELEHGGRIAVTRVLSPETVRQLVNRPDVLSVKVWRPDGVVAYTNLEQERIGKRYPISDQLRGALDGGGGEAEFANLGKEEDEAEAHLGVKNVVEAYVPIRVSATGKPIGAYEIYADASKLTASIADRRKLIWAATGGVFLALWLGSVLLVRGASRTLRRQWRELQERSAALAESYEKLESSTLEAIESLNATVEAKDPYTAGHSKRVHDISLQIGLRLGLSEPEFDALRYGALFHDIGKIAIPDAILTKPARLTEEEYEVMKTHSLEGARIAAKFGRLREAVPVIRHHHERWDGRGYPGGLADERIPRGATIVGLADAWDAMTTERPYSAAKSHADALEELRRGRGAQFAPEVVDAMLALASEGKLLVNAREAAGVDQTALSSVSSVK